MAHDRSDLAMPGCSIDALRLRAKLLQQVRQFFDSRQFLEVETPLLSQETVVDRYLEPFTVSLAKGASEEATPAIPLPSDSAATAATQSATSTCAAAPVAYLQTSPEFHMKRLLAAGSGPIYQIGRAFRDDEQGRLHNSEFTIIEWYEPGANMEKGIALLAELSAELLCEPATSPTIERLSYQQAFLRYAAVDPLAASVPNLIETAQKHGLHPPAGLGEDRDDWLDYLLVELVEPNLGQATPTILYHYPATQAALARTVRLPLNDSANHPHDAACNEVAERFELYVHGIELANGYHELTDPQELRRRNAKINRQRIADGKAPLPEESLMLQAMERGLPESAGCALGFDRVVMIAAEANCLSEVMPFPQPRA